jgi:hypothetical protein
MFFNKVKEMLTYYIQKFHSTMSMYKVIVGLKCELVSFNKLIKELDNNNGYMNDKLCDVVMKLVHESDPIPSSLHNFYKSINIERDSNELAFISKVISSMRRNDKCTLPKFDDMDLHGIIGYFSSNNPSTKTVN